MYLLWPVAVQKFPFACNADKAQALLPPRPEAWAAYHDVAAGRMSWLSHKTIAAHQSYRHLINKLIAQPALPRPKHRRPQNTLAHSLQTPTANHYMPQ